MRDPLPVPRTGDPMRASWGAGVATRLNELCGMAAPGSLARDGLTGLGSEPLPVNRRDRKAAAPRTPYWSFACTEDPDTHERTGGWFNCRLQIGYDRFPKDSDIQGLDSCEDGEYYVEVNTLTDAAEVKCVELDAAVPTTDVAQSLVRIPIGRVEDAKLSGKPIDIIPVVYKYV